MFFKINPSNGVPVYEQVSRQIMFAVASGSISTGELIPSVRELARELAINPNTVARAFRDLQDQDILLTVRGTGVSVAKGAKSKCVSARTRLFREQIRAVLDEARQSQLDDDELRKIVDTEIQNSKKKRQRN
ncbi:MAG: GntR family transcriptional regulator [Mariniblastus sp.]